LQSGSCNNSLSSAQVFFNDLRYLDLRTIDEW